MKSGLKDFRCASNILKGFISFLSLQTRHFCEDTELRLKRFALHSLFILDFLFELGE